MMYVTVLVCLLTFFIITTEEPLVIVKKETNQFVVAHCQRSMPVLYNVSGWLRRAREHPSYRVVAQVLSESKRYSLCFLLSVLCMPNQYMQ